LGAGATGAGRAHQGQDHRRGFEYRGSQRSDEIDRAPRHVYLSHQESDLLVRRGRAKIVPLPNVAARRLGGRGLQPPPNKAAAEVLARILLVFGSMLNIVVRRAPAWRTVAPANVSRRNARRPRTRTPVHDPTARSSRVCQCFHVTHNAFAGDGGSEPRGHKFFFGLEDGFLGRVLYEIRGQRSL
jgi:hypothetical protein